MDLRALIFMPALVGCVVFGFVFALFAAHYYLTVLQSTGSGSKEVVWVSEPILDNFWKMFYLAWLIGLWLGPAWLLGRRFASGTEVVWVKFAVPLAMFWVCYPVSQLSSLSGPTVWLPLHPDVFGRLARKPVVLLGFMGLSGATLAVLGLGFYWTFHAAGLVWLFVGSPLFVIAGLLYARLLGRLAFALMFTRSILARRKKKKTQPPKAADRASPGPEDEAEHIPSESAEADGGFAQPSKLPPIQTPDEGALSGYDVKFEDDAPRVRKRVVAQVAETEPSPSKSPARPAEPVRGRKRPHDDEDEDAYGVHAAEVQPDERAPVDVVKPSADEMRLLNRDDAPKPPKRVWTAEVFAFLLQPGTVAVVLVLSAMCVAVGGMVRIALAYNPVAGGM